MKALPRRTLRGSPGKTDLTGMDRMDRMDRIKVPGITPETGCKVLSL
jgi:hypothetical protein